jgi:NADP-dependent 3-hydroxy acid dehydrogenase YdfG
LREIKSLGRKAVAVPCDVSDYKATKKAVEIIYQEFGAIDILVNNAGIDRAGFFKDTDETLWDSLIRTNYKGFLVSTHVCLPYMMKGKRCHREPWFRRRENRKFGELSIAAPRPRLWGVQKPWPGNLPV